MTLGLIVLLLVTVPARGEAPEEPRRSVLVQAADLATARQAARDVGVEITHELGIIRAVAAEVTDQERRQLEEHDGVLRVYDNREVRTE